jgi:hypothetical protein
MCSPKEPNFFCPEFESKQHTRKLDEYLQLFSGARPMQTAIGEASVWYLLSESAAANIRNFCPSARIIIMVRNPVDLVYSLHSQLLWTLDENLADFCSAWGVQSERLAGNSIPMNCREPRFLQYCDVGKIGEQTSRYFYLFPASQIKVIYFEDFTNATRDVYHEVLEFLKVPIINRETFPQINASKTHKNHLIAKVTQRPPQWIIGAVSLAKRITGIKRFNLLNRIKLLTSTQSKRPPLPSFARHKVFEAFEQDIHLLSRLTDRNLDHWK